MWITCIKVAITGYATEIFFYAMLNGCPQIHIHVNFFDVCEDVS